mmetsp:Transcript_28042/g.36236  ORF Transcript_28042/g.36236 Transcript_28042/m.36236 type:complete len:107 (-) Transcript_28042:1365-1685(-)
MALDDADASANSTLSDEGDAVLCSTCFSIWLWGLVLGFSFVDVDPPVFDEIREVAFDEGGEAFSDCGRVLGRVFACASKEDLWHPCIPPYRSGQHSTLFWAGVRDR